MRFQSGLKKKVCTKKLKKVEPRRHKGREGGEVLNREGAKYAKEVVL